MANSEVHQTKASHINQINNFRGDNGLKRYPPSVTELSAMIVQAHKESLPECAELGKSKSSEALDTPPPNDATRAVFKKSHTCGSLFAKCGCNNDNSGRVSLFQTFSNPASASTSKRASSPSIHTSYQNADTKRLSNPEINSLEAASKYGECRPKRNSNTVIKRVYLNHPEITFPITVEVPKESPENCDTTVPNQKPKTYNHPDFTNTNTNLANLDYHKFTALAYEKQFENDPARKFLNDFGIFGPMGNGVTTTKKNSKSSSSDCEIIQRIRKSSKVIDNKNKTGVPDDYDYLKNLVPRLEKEVANLEVKYAGVQSDLLNTKKELTCKESEVLRLKREIHKLKVSATLYIYAYTVFVPLLSR